MRKAAVLSLCLTFAICVSAGCGAPETTGPTTIRVETESLDVPKLLRTYGAERHPVFEPPTDSFETLERARVAGRGPERIKALRDLAVAHLWAAEATDDENAKRVHIRQAERFAEKAIAGRGDPIDAAAAEFVLVWSTWRRGAPRADRVAEVFIRRRADSLELVMLAWMIRGEVALAGKQWSDARQHFRFLLGQLEHPLYAFALYRSAEALKGANQSAEAEQVFSDVRDLGCGPQAGGETVMMASYAAAQVGTEVRRDESGKLRPVSCAVVAAGEGSPSGSSEPVKR